MIYEVRVYSNGDKFWFFDDKKHREDGPAVEYANGSKEWYIHGNLHREGGPAVEYASGYKAWFLNGKRHRTDGPATEYADGDKHWYIHGKKVTQEEHYKLSAPCNGKEVKIDGVTYVLKVK